MRRIFLFVFLIIWIILITGCTTSTQSVVKPSSTIPAPTGGGSLIERVVVTGSPGTHLTLTGLNLQKSTTYNFYFMLQSTTTNEVGYYWTVNEDNTASHYYETAFYMHNADTSLQYHNANSNEINDNDAAGGNSLCLNIYTLVIAPDGKVYGLGHEGGYTTAETGVQSIYYTIPVSSITSIDISASVPNTLAVGSYAEIYYAGSGGPP